MIDDFLDRLEHKAKAAWENIDPDHFTAFQQSSVTKALLAQLEYEMHALLYQTVEQPIYDQEIEKIALTNARNGAKVEYLNYLAAILKAPQNRESMEFEDVDTNWAQADSQA